MSVGVGFGPLKHFLAVSVRETGSIAVSCGADMIIEWENLNGDCICADSYKDIIELVNCEL